MTVTEMCKFGPGNLVGIPFVALGAMTGLAGHRSRMDGGR